MSYQYRVSRHVNITTYYRISDKYTIEAYSVALEGWEFPFSQSGTEDTAKRFILNMPSATEEEVNSYIMLWELSK